MSEAEVRYRYRLRVGDGQAAALQDVFDSCRFVWNQALGRWGDLWRHEAERLTYGDASDRVFRCRGCGLVLDRDRNAARNLNPDRPRPGGGAGPPGDIAGGDGTKPKVPAGILAA